MKSQIIQRSPAASIFYTFIFLYSTTLLCFYIYAIFFRDQNADYFYVYTLKNQSLILVYLLCYSIGSFFFFAGSKYRGDIFLLFASIGFSICASIDLAFNLTYSIILYLLYIFGNLAVLFLLDKQVLNRKLFLFAVTVAAILSIVCLQLNGNLII